MKENCNSKSQSSKTIRAMTHQGVTFRNAVELRWARWFDVLEIEWGYEGPCNWFLIHHLGRGFHRFALSFEPSAPSWDRWNFLQDAGRYSARETWVLVGGFEKFRRGVWSRHERAQGLEHCDHYTVATALTDGQVTRSDAAAAAKRALFWEGA